MQYITVQYSTARTVVRLYLFAKLDTATSHTVTSLSSSPRLWVLWVDPPSWYSMNRIKLNHMCVGRARYRIIQKYHYYTRAIFELYSYNIYLIGVCVGVIITFNRLRINKGRIFNPVPVPLRTLALQLAHWIWCLTHGLLSFLPLSRRYTVFVVTLHRVNPDFIRSRNSMLVR